jgi:predicted phage-related endonuclease
MKLIPKPIHGSQEWLLTRWKDENGQCVFGASDIPALMNASPYSNRSALLADKLSEPVVKPTNAVFERGNLLESPLLVNASRVLGTEIITPNVVYRDGRLSISLDGVDDENSPNVVVEAKTTTKYSVSSSDDLPAEWLWQGWAQQAVLQVPVWFSVLDRQMNLSVVELPDNPAAIEALSIEAEFFGNIVDSGDLSELGEEELQNFFADDIARIWKAEPTSIELPSDAWDWINQLEEARMLSKQGEELEKKAKDALAQMLLQNEFGLIDGQQVLSWKSQAGRASLDTVRLKAEHPELVEEYQKQGAPFRVMRIVKAKAK